MDFLSSTIAPIHRLPNELLGQILLSCRREQGRNPWKLGSIDSRTRNIVISTPLFWITLHVGYIHGQRFNFESLIEKLRMQLRRCGPVLPLTVFWVTVATEHHISRLLWLFIEENAPLDRWEALTVKAQGVFPASMLTENRLGEFANLKVLAIAGTHPHFFFHHLEKTRDLGNLKEVSVGVDTLPYEKLVSALPRVMGATKSLTLNSSGDFTTSLPSNIMVLKCFTLFNRSPFPHLKELSVILCSIRLHPLDIPCVTHLEIYFNLSWNLDTVLEFPALTSLVLECAKNDLRPLTWFAAPNITFFKLKLPAFSNSLSHPGAPPITQLNFLTYPRVANLQIKIPLDLEELCALLPRFPATSDMVIPLNTSGRESMDTVLLDLLTECNSVESKQESAIRYPELTNLVLISSGEVDVHEADWKDRLRHRFPDSKLHNLTIRLSRWE